MWLVQIAVLVYIKIDLCYSCVTDVHKMSLNTSNITSSSNILYTLDNTKVIPFSFLPLLQGAAPFEEML